MRIAIAQISPIVGDFEHNIALIRAAYEKAVEEKADLLVTPELSVCGYPPHDLIARPEIFVRNERALKELLEITRGQSCALLVGHVGLNPAPTGKEAQNVASVLLKGEKVFSQAKSLLPTYDVFDEARYFEPASEVKVWEWQNQKIGIAICEDLWIESGYRGRVLYEHGPEEVFQKHGVDLVISLSASPYEFEKHKNRESTHSAIAKRLGASLVYVNQVGATDEILFDGGSFVATNEGEISHRLDYFEPGFGLCEVQGSNLKWEKGELLEKAPSSIEVLTRGLVTGIRDYFARTGFRQALIGLSGGIDSAVVCALAVKALGAENVRGVAMPGLYSSGHSIEDAEALAKNLGIEFELQSIKFFFSTMKRELSGGRGELGELALENLQARLRGMILLTLANHYGALVVTTSNKSELATGYCTQYGDMVGALAPIGDLFKTRVYEVAQVIQSWEGKWIPQRSIEKPPSAELKPDQKDEDTLPPYPILDELLEAYVEKCIDVEQLKAEFSKKYSKENWVPEILRLVERSEFKRRQAAPPLKTSPKAFGIGRRVPIAKVWDQKSK